MVSSALLLSAVAALAASAAASPIEKGIKIPLPKRASLRSTNGVVDFGKLNRHLIKTEAKYAKSQANYLHNTGKVFKTGIETTVHSTSVIERTMDTEEPLIVKRQSEALTDEEEDLEWAGTITIGSNSQSFLIDFDTGSSDLWVPSSSCTSGGCSGKHKYNPSTSSTSSKKSGTFSISYGDGSTASGPIYTDTVTVAGVSASSQYFSATSSESASFADDPIDGILGLAFPSISSLGQNPYFYSIYNQGKVSTATFAFRLASTGSELYLGGANSAHYTGSITYVSLTSATYWLTSGSVLVSGSTVLSGVPMIIDTGTTLIVGPTSSVKSFYSSFGGTACTTSTCGSGSSGYYTFTCSSQPTISFKLGSATWAIASADFNLGSVSSTKCVGAVVGTSGVPDNAWIMGDSFLKSVYSVYDVSNQRVGFATPR